MQTIPPSIVLNPEDHLGDDERAAKIVAFRETILRSVPASKRQVSCQTNPDARKPEKGRRG